uniref:Uncharacterized protein n=1 Tax=Salmo trutta TaxID=8032 RepID=A0A674C6Z2_SALTR
MHSPLFHFLFWGIFLNKLFFPFHFTSLDYCVWPLHEIQLKIHLNYSGSWVFLHLYPHMQSEPTVFLSRQYPSKYIYFCILFMCLGICLFQFN